MESINNNNNNNNNINNNNKQYKKKKQRNFLKMLQKNQTILIMIISVSISQIIMHGINCIRINDTSKCSSNNHFSNNNNNNNDNNKYNYYNSMLSQPKNFMKHTPRAAATTTTITITITPRIESPLAIELMTNNYSTKAQQRFQPIASLISANRKSSATAATTTTRNTIADRMWPKINSDTHDSLNSLNPINRLKRSVFHVRWHPNEKYIVESLEKPAINSSKYSPHPRLKVSKTTKLTFNPKLYLCREKYENQCLNRTWAYRERIVHILEKSLDDMIINATNFYNVDFKSIFGDSFEEQYYPSSCLIMEAGVNVLRRKDAPFNKLPFGKLLPRQKLFRHNKNIKTCAIVSSAGSMAGSKLGRFIDTHDIVMRFNDAPTRGYEADVGSKTTIRVLNSQVVTKNEYNFTRADIFRNVTIAAWDPGKYNNSLEDWLTTADYDLFTNYEIYRRRNPKSRAFLVDPHSIWRLWQSLQTFAGNRPIRKNPPSSGFIGLALLLPYCPIIHFIEYIPSTRLNGRCHYYNKEINSACTFGTWHPLAAEKLMALDMNVADDISVFQYGILRIQRPNKLLCGFNFFGY